MLKNNDENQTNKSVSKEVYVRESKYLALLLRHQPEKADINMGSDGWVEVSELISNVNNIRGANYFTEDKLKTITQTDNKGRYSFSEDGSFIRANQGHSINVDVGLVPTAPPEVLYHGTSTRYAALIDEGGLKKKNRLYIHLSSDPVTAKSVGSRHCSHGEKVVIYSILAERMAGDGYEFLLSANGVWLTDSVAPKYLQKN